MLAATLLITWRRARWLVVALAVLTFAVPVIATGSLGSLAMADLPVRDVLVTFRTAGAVLIPLALLLGLTVAGATWAEDQELGLVYMLVHPVPRWYLILLRFTAGAIVAMGPGLSLLIPCVAVSVLVRAPDLLQAYPIAVTVRFAACTLVTFSGFFCLQGLIKRPTDQAAAARQALLWLGGTVCIVIAAFALDRTVLHGALERGLSTFLQGRWSPLLLFIGRWGLYDV